MHSRRKSFIISSLNLMQSGFEMRREKKKEKERKKERKKREKERRRKKEDKISPLLKI